MSDQAGGHDADQEVWDKLMRVVVADAHAAGRAEMASELREMVKAMIANLWKHQSETKGYLDTLLAKLPTPEAP